MTVHRPDRSTRATARGGLAGDHEHGEAAGREVLGDRPPRGGCAAVAVGRDEHEALDALAQHGEFAERAHAVGGVDVRDGEGCRIPESLLLQPAPHGERVRPAAREHELLGGHAGERDVRLGLRDLGCVDQGDAAPEGREVRPPVDGDTSGVGPHPSRGDESEHGGPLLGLGGDEGGAARREDGRRQGQGVLATAFADRVQFDLHAPEVLGVAAVAGASTSGWASSSAAASRHERPAMLSTARTARSRRRGRRGIHPRDHGARGLLDEPRERRGGDVGAQHLGVLAVADDAHHRAPQRGERGRGLFEVGLVEGDRREHLDVTRPRSTARRPVGPVPRGRRRRRWSSAIGVEPCRRPVRRVRAPARRGRRSARTAPAASVPPVERWRRSMRAGRVRGRRRRSEDAGAVLEGVAPRPARGIDRGVHASRLIILHNAVQDMGRTHGRGSGFAAFRRAKPAMSGPQVPAHPVGRDRPSGRAEPAPGQSVPESNADASFAASVASASSSCSALNSSACSVISPASPCVRWPTSSPVVPPMMPAAA